MFKTTTIAGAAALALGTLGATAHAADYKGPDLKGETITVPLEHLPSRSRA